MPATPHDEGPRAYTTDEVRQRFLEHVWVMIDFWEKQVTQDMPLHERLTGLAFSLLSTLDGSAMDLPSFLVAPMPHKSDKAYHTKEGENYYPYNSGKGVQGDIGGCLHELFHDVGRTLGYEPPQPPLREDRSSS
jgi:hypothetical protein